MRAYGIDACARRKGEDGRAKKKLRKSRRACGVTRRSVILPKPTAEAADGLIRLAEGLTASCRDENTIPHAPYR